MKSYLRFLLLGAVLLFLLGYFNNQRSDSATDPSEPAGLEQHQQQPGLLPILPTQAFPKPISIQKHPGGNPVAIQLRQEVFIGELTKNTFQKARRVIEDNTPGLIQRKGYFIHECCTSVIPS